MSARRAAAASALAGALAACAWAAGAQAELIETSEHGFTIRYAFTAEAAPEAAYGALIDVAHWWNPEHSYFEGGDAFSLDARAGGCFCETGAEGSVKHAEVVQVFENRSMRWLGALGPLQGMGLSSVHDWTIEPSEDGVVVTYVNRVRGWPGDELEVLAPIVDAVQVDQMQRLERFIATGDPEAP